MPSPLRWPIVKFSIPSCRPTTAPAEVTISPAVRVASRPAADEIGMIAAGDEANLLAILLVRHPQAQFMGQPANLRFSITADRKHHSR